MISDASGIDLSPAARDCKRISFFRVECDGFVLRVLGGRGNDVIRVSYEELPFPSAVPSEVTLSGGSGKDRLEGGTEDETLSGSSGNDRLNGGSGSDRLSGGSGSDWLKGGRSRDELKAGSGRDSIHARDGRRDRVDCGRGRDTVAADRYDRLRRCERVSRR